MNLYSLKGNIVTKKAMKKKFFTFRMAAKRWMSGVKLLLGNVAAMTGGRSG